MNSIRSSKSTLVFQNATRRHVLKAQNEALFHALDTLHGGRMWTEHEVNSLCRTQLASGLLSYDPEKKSTRIQVLVDKLKNSLRPPQPVTINRVWSRAVPRLGTQEFQDHAFDLIGELGSPAQLEGILQEYRDDLLVEVMHVESQIKKVRGRVETDVTDDLFWERNNLYQQHLHNAGIIRMSTSPSSSKCSLKSFRILHHIAELQIYLDCFTPYIRMVTRRASDASSSRSSDSESCCSSPPARSVSKFIRDQLITLNLGHLKP
jgi:hypothetical protein